MEDNCKQTCNPNRAGLIYYGTDIKYLADIDNNGMKKPRYRKEQYISVSVSGYKGILPCKHRDLRRMAEVFSKELKVAFYNEGILHYREGYVNSLTCFQGFGVCPNKYIHTFDGFVDNKERDNKLTVVISDKASIYLAQPDKHNIYEYLSLAIHSFIKEIREEDIIGYIIDSRNREQVMKMMSGQQIKNRMVWTEKDFTASEITDANSARYKISDE